ncbi:MAG: hypothetical protein HQL59_12600 [Magnetococcales bacterium]|nr:hypothetical protein [Magnetococcales bacterium]
MNITNAANFLIERAVSMAANLGQQSKEEAGGGDASAGRCQVIPESGRIGATNSRFCLRLSGHDLPRCDAETGDESGCPGDGLTGFATTLLREWLTGR